MGGIGAIAVTAPAAVAAAGLYFLDKYHYHYDKANNMTKEVGDGLNDSGMQTSKANWIAKLKGQSKATQPSPKFAPEFDGLHCFETLVVGH